MTPAYTTSLQDTEMAELRATIDRLTVALEEAEFVLRRAGCDITADKCLVALGQEEQK